MRIRRYKCYHCGFEDDMVIRDEHPIYCPECEGLMKQKMGFRVVIDDWTPMTNDAQRDIEHFAKKSVINGKYVSNNTMYREDRMKKDIPVNISEV